LEAHEWSFANAHKDLSATVEESPNPNFPYSFTLPNDCIAPRAVISIEDCKEKKYEPGVDSSGAKIIMAEFNPVKLRYTRRITNETFFTAAFVVILIFHFPVNFALLVLLGKSFPFIIELFTFRKPYFNLCKSCGYKYFQRNYGITVFFNFGMHL